MADLLLTASSRFSSSTFHSSRFQCFIFVITIRCTCALDAAGEISGSLAIRWVVPTRSSIFSSFRPTLRLLKSLPFFASLRVRLRDRWWTVNGSEADRWVDNVTRARWWTRNFGVPSFLNRSWCFRAYLREGDGSSCVLFSSVQSENPTICGGEAFAGAAVTY